MAPSQAGGERIPSTWRIPALSMSASFVRHFMPFVVLASPCCPQLLFSLLHLPFPHSQPGWPCWVCALRASQDVATERANVGKARAWLYVHSIRSVNVHRLRIPVFELREALCLLFLALVTGLLQPNRRLFILCSVNLTHDKSITESL